MFFRHIHGLKKLQLLQKLPQQEEYELINLKTNLINTDGKWEIRDGEEETISAF